MAKREKLEEARAVFAGTGVQITDESQRYLGGALGSDAFIYEYLGAQVAEWTGEVRRLATFSHTQPHAAFASLIHGLTGRWTYTLRGTEIPSGEFL